MKPEKRTIPSSEHEQVYHAAVRCQAASLSLTARRLHGLKKACSVEGKKTGGVASQNKGTLSGFDGVERPGRLKDGRNVGLMRTQHGEDDPHPYVRQGTDCDTMTFPASRTFALVVGGSPGLAQSTLPGKLMQGITQGLDTPLASMRLRVVSALRTSQAKCLPALANWQHFHNEKDRLRFQKASGAQGVCQLWASS
jgi:hypothetical protein